MRVTIQFAYWSICKVLEAGISLYLLFSLRLQFSLKF